jgi:hypothetical protein
VLSSVVFTWWVSGLCSSVLSSSFPWYGRGALSRQSSSLDRHPCGCEQCRAEGLGWFCITSAVMC